MYIPFENIADHARIWIYQSNRKFSERDKDILTERLSSFTNAWLVHGNPMSSSFSILYDYFVAIVADENVNAASGCSIDDSVRTMKSLGSELNINFFDRNNIAFLTNDEITLVAMQKLKGAFEEGEWNGQSRTFNNLIGTKGDLVSKWIIPAGMSWLKRYLPHESLSS